MKQGHGLSGDVFRIAVAGGLKVFRIANLMKNFDTKNIGKKVNDIEHLEITLKNKVRLFS